MLYLGTGLRFPDFNVGIHWCALVLIGVCTKFGAFWGKTHIFNEKHVFFQKKTPFWGGQIQKIENIDGFRVFRTLKMPNIHSTS